jgi:hypothetical protein
MMHPGWEKIPDMISLSLILHWKINELLFVEFWCSPLPRISRSVKIGRVWISSIFHNLSMCRWIFKALSHLNKILQQTGCCTLNMRHCAPASVRLYKRQNIFLASNQASYQVLKKDSVPWSSLGFHKILNSAHTSMCSQTVKRHIAQHWFKIK